MLSIFLKGDHSHSCSGWQSKGTFPRIIEWLSQVCPVHTLEDKELWNDSKLLKDLHLFLILCLYFVLFLFFKGYWRFTKPHWRACGRWLQKDGNTFWWTEQKPHQHGLHKDVFWRTNCRTSNSHFLLGYAVVPRPASLWTSRYSLPCHYLRAAVRYGQMSIWFDIW